MSQLTHRSSVLVRFGLIAGVAALLLSSTPAAAEGEPGLWYYDRYLVAEAHAQGYLGQGVKIAVIDGPINPNLPEFAGAKLTVNESSYCDLSETDSSARLPGVTASPDAQHATSMVSLLISNGNGVGGQQAPKGVAPAAEVAHYAALMDYGFGADDLDCFRDGKRSQADSAGIGEAMRAAVDDGAHIISMSIGSFATAGIKSAYIYGLRKGVIFIASLPNDKIPTLPGDLTALNGLITMQALDENKMIQAESDMAWMGADVVGPGVNIRSITSDFTQYGVTNGTSNATVLTAGMLAVVKSKYPEATSNQLIQSLIHNTGPDDHELEFDETGYWGYGPVSLQHMLREDPAQYPDENPLIEKDSKTKVVFPTYEEIFGTDSETPTPTAAPLTPEKKPKKSKKSSVEIGAVPERDSSLPPIAFAGLVGAAVVIVSGAGAWWFFAKRRQTRLRDIQNVAFSHALQGGFPVYSQAPPPPPPPPAFSPER